MSDFDSLSSPVRVSGPERDTADAPPHEGTARRKRKSASLPRHDEKRRRSDQIESMLSTLTAQVSGIQQFLSHKYPQSNNNEPDNDNESVISLNVSEELFNDPEMQESVTQASPPPAQTPLPTSSPVVAAAPRTEFAMSINTVLKEPAIPKSDPALVDRLNTIQHFNTIYWSDIRYSDAQKKYCSTPGFTELECNDDLKPYDTFSNLSLTERGFAAITQGLLKQQEALEKGFQGLMTFLKTEESLTIENIEGRIKEIFAKGDYSTISNDLLQMSCGHRADMIQQRRDAILRSVKDKYVKASLRKIPPSSDELFKSDELTSTLDKNGGMSKVFWPTKSQPSTSKGSSTASANTNNAKYARPPAQGTFNSQTSYNNNFNPPPAHGPIFHPYAFPPAQGAVPFMSYGPRMPAQGQNFRPTGPRASGNTNFRQQRPGPSRRGQTKKKY